MNCEICGRKIIKNRHFLFEDAEKHYLHKSCFNKFSRGRIYVDITERGQDTPDSRIGSDIKKKETDGNPNND